MMRLAVILSLLLLVVTLPSCKHIDDQRIPPAPVRLEFRGISEWNTYGAPGALNHRRYIKPERIPSDYPYTMLSQTGFGGILIVGDILGAPRAYDLACPVECKADVRIIVDTEASNAYCPRCHSVYDIFTNYGQPLSGPAHEDGYGLQKYYIGAGTQGEYMVVTR